MKKVIKFFPATDADTHRGYSRFDEEINVNSSCPICKHAINPIVYDGLYHLHPSGVIEAFVMHLCPNCESLYCSKYGAANDRHLLSLDASYPYARENIAFPQCIQDISANFCKIYNESYVAEKQGLTSICGVGYRKALEFLTKDYMIRKSPDDTEAIRKESLGQTINRIDDIRIKTLSERTAWIGNDETHYVRKHENKDMSDMKKFIEALINFIVYESTFEEALSMERK